MLIHCNFPGGNINLIEQNSNMIKLTQDLKNCSQWWFYWNFCVEAPNKGEITFEFCNGEVIGPWGPAVSFDRLNWSWAGKSSKVSPTTFKYTFEGNEHKVYFCFSFPYQMQDFERFLYKYSHLNYIKKQALTVSEKGRPVPLIVAGNSAAGKHIFLTCRHHACESVASYVLEGLLEYILDRNYCRLLDNYQFHIVPFIDIDGAEEGDQGKGRPPHDHNRDYTDKPIYKSTSGLMDYARLKKPEIFIDLHCPWKWGSDDNISSQRNNHVFFTKNVTPVKEEVEKLSNILAKITEENSNTNKIIFNPLYNISMGDDWLQPAPTSTDFFKKLGSKISLTCECTYFGTDNMIITQKNSREFGRDLARALEEYVTLD